MIPAGSITIYSEAATAAGFNPFPNWGQATQYVEATIAGNKSLKYTSLNYEGIEFTAVDVSCKGKIHFDFWSPDLTSVKVSIISAGKENAYTQALTTGSWNSVDIDLSNYTAGQDGHLPDQAGVDQPRHALRRQHLLLGHGGGGGGGGSCGTTDPTCAPTTVIPAGSATIYSDAASAAGFDPCPNWGQATLCSEADDRGQQVAEVHGPELRGHRLVIQCGRTSRPRASCTSTSGRPT